MSTPTAAQQHQNANDKLFQALLERDKLQRDLAALDLKIAGLTHFVAGVQTGVQMQKDAVEPPAGLELR
jgi:hypothetical protein